MYGVALANVKMSSHWNARTRDMPMDRTCSGVISILPPATYTPCFRTTHPGGKDFRCDDPGDHTPAKTPAKGVDEDHGDANITASCRARCRTRMADLDEDGEVEETESLDQSTEHNRSSATNAVN